MLLGWLWVFLPRKRKKTQVSAARPHEKFGVALGKVTWFFIKYTVLLPLFLLWLLIVALRSFCGAVGPKWKPRFGQH